MKKTLLITHEYYPYRGGIARYCYNLFEHFSSASYSVASDQKERDHRVPIIPVRFLSSFLRPRWLKGVYAVQRLVKEQQIELIMTPNILPLGQIAQQIFRLTKIPYVISLHGLDINLGLQKKRATTISILKGAKHIITNSEATRRIYAGLKLTTPTTVITPYLDAERLVVQERTLRDLKRRYGKKKIILTVGRLVKRKGQDMVIRAMPAILRRVPDAHYCIVGAGPERKYLEECIREERMQRHVDILGSVSDAELGAYYASSSIFAMPTRALGQDVEGFGIVYLEAAHFALPIVAGKTGGEPEAIGSDDSGIYVDGADPADIAEALWHLLEDSELAAFLGKNAQKHLAKIPTWRDQAQKLEQILS